MMKLAMAVACVLGLVLGVEATAQDVKSGANGLKGTIVTGSCTAAPGTACTVLSAPQKGGLVITTGCLTHLGPGGHSGFVRSGEPLSLQCLGTLGGISAPQSYQVGYVVEPGTDLTCENPASGTTDINCTASGVLTKK